jgi:hypothetical protein
MWAPYWLSFPWSSSNGHLSFSYVCPFEWKPSAHSRNPRSHQFFFINKWPYNSLRKAIYYIIKRELWPWISSWITIWFLLTDCNLWSCDESNILLAFVFFFPFLKPTICFHHDRTKQSGSKRNEIQERFLIIFFSLITCWTSLSVFILYGPADQRNRKCIFIYNYSLS